MAYVPSTTPPAPPHPNLAAYRAALRDIVRFNRLQRQIVAIEAAQLAEGL